MRPMETEKAYTTYSFSSLETLRRHPAIYLDASELPKTEPRVRRFREIVATIVKKNRRIGELARKSVPFYRGKIHGPAPKLEAALDPKRNGSYACMKEFAAAAKALRPGEFPIRALLLFHLTTLRLIELDLEPLHRPTALNRQKRLLADILQYLSSPQSEFSQSAHETEIRQFVKNWNCACYENSDAFYLQEGAIKAQQRETSPAKPKRPARRGVHGQQTTRMKKQRKDFAEFLRQNPVNETESCGTVAARASQFWNLNKKTFETAAKALGEKRGYKTSKALASAYRASKS